METLPPQSTSAPVDANQPATAIESNPADTMGKGVDMQTLPAQDAFSKDTAAANAPYCEPEPVSFRQRVSMLSQGFQRLLVSAKASRQARRAALAEQQRVAVVADDEGGAPVDVAQQEGLITQINDGDRAYMQAFPAQLKAQVLNKISLLEPDESVVYHGNNRFEKAMMIIHREGYGLIDMQPHETAFSSVWYRKGRKLTGKNAEVTMLMWEESEHGDVTTVVRWGF